MVEFTRLLNVSKNQIEHLKNLTKEQASSEIWLEQRWVRMTASNFHRICSRMNKLTKNPDENPNNLLRSLLYSKPFESEETKYEKSMEPHAIQKFISENKRLPKSDCTIHSIFLPSDSHKKDSPSYILDLGQSKSVKSELCVTICKNDSGLSNILDPAESKAVERKLSDPAKNAKKTLFYCSSCENILKDKPKVYKDFCVAYDICVWFHYKCAVIPREK